MSSATRNPVQLLARGFVETASPLETATGFLSACCRHPDTSVADVQGKIIDSFQKMLMEKCLRAGKGLKAVRAVR